MAKTAPRSKPSKQKISARKPAAKPAAKAAKRATAPTTAPVVAPLAAASSDALLEQLASATGLQQETLLQRALQAFAAAHGIALAAQQAPALPQQIVALAAAPVAQPAAAVPAEAAPVAAAQAEAVDETPALGPNTRLYVHGIGRPPQEMIRKTFFIGSSPKCDLWVNAPKIETRHLRIDREGEKYLVTDLSQSGTKLHGEQIPQRYEIKHEDSFYLAGYHLVRFYVLS